MLVKYPLPTSVYDDWAVNISQRMLKVILQVYVQSLCFDMHVHTCVCVCVCDYDIYIDGLIDRLIERVRGREGVWGSVCVCVRVGGKSTNSEECFRNGILMSNYI